MKPLPSCLLYTRDGELEKRLARMSASVVAIQPIAEQVDLEQWLEQRGDTVLLADLRAPNCLEVLAQIRKEYPLTVVIVIGVERSDPMLLAEWIEPYATLSLDPEYRDVPVLLRQATETLDLRKKNHILEAEVLKLNTLKREPSPEPRDQLSAPLQHFSKAQRNVDNLEKLFDSVVDGLVDSARVSRAGLFIRSEEENCFIFQAGNRCLTSTEALSFTTADPFVRWLETHTHMVFRRNLDHIQDTHERALLLQALDALGAEVIIPLQADGPILGWIFAGPRATGIPFELADLEALTGLSDHISTTLEKALQFKENALQKVLAETLLHSIPFGIIACDDQGLVRWFNSTARNILRLKDDTVIGARVEKLGSHIADMLRRAVEGERPHSEGEWTDPHTRRSLSAETRRLESQDTCIGAMMMLRDMTETKLLQEKEDQLEREAFWNDLASGMSHEIRNPLVAIKTFAQLLPDRYDDADFRAEFGEQVTAEVDKLNHIVDKINGFADAPPLVFAPIDIRRPIECAVSRIQAELDDQKLKIDLIAEDPVLRLEGDTDTLEECVYHLLRNAAENLVDKNGARIDIRVKSHLSDEGSACIYLVVSDNGSGIDASLKDKLFSPFSTTKARGLGLGLPIAKRAVIDHNGQIDITTGESGTSITITLPAHPPSPSAEQ